MSKSTQKRVFPILLDADSAELTAAGTIKVDTSYTILNASGADTAITLPDGTIPGQVMIIMNKHASGTPKVTITTPTLSIAKTASLDTQGSQVTCVWTGSGWSIISGEATTIVAAS